MNSSNLNLTATTSTPTTTTHNGFGINHSMIQNQTHSTNHFNSTTQSTLTYRSNRRSMDRSENKIGETISTAPSHSTSSINDPIHEDDVSHSRSYINMCMHVIYKMIMFVYCGFGKRRVNSLNDATHARLPESVFGRFLYALNYRAIGNGAGGGGGGGGGSGGGFVGSNSNCSSDNGGSGNNINSDSALNYARNVSNENGNEQIGYIERIDDENLETADLRVNTKLTASFVSNAPTANELSTAGKCFILFDNLIDIFGAN